MLAGSLEVGPSVEPKEFAEEVRLAFVLACLCLVGWALSLRDLSLELSLLLPLSSRSFYVDSAVLRQ